jgi:hypothetical protein
MEVSQLRKQEVMQASSTQAEGYVSEKELYRASPKYKRWGEFFCYFELSPGLVRLSLW